MRTPEPWHPPKGCIGLHADVMMRQFKVIQCPTKQQTFLLQVQQSKSVGPEHVLRKKSRTAPFHMRYCDYADVQEDCDAGHFIHCPCFGDGIYHDLTTGLLLRAVVETLSTRILLENP